MDDDLPTFDREARWTLGRLVSLLLVALFVSALLVGICASINPGVD